MREIIPDRFKNCKIYNKNYPKLGIKKIIAIPLVRIRMLIKMLEGILVVYFWIR